MRLDLIFTMTRDIDIYSNLHLPKKIAAVAKASSYKISTNGTCLK